jgi:hypothetical protein
LWAQDKQIEPVPSFHGPPQAAWLWNGLMGKTAQIYSFLLNYEPPCGTVPAQSFCAYQACFQASTKVLEIGQLRGTTYVSDLLLRWGPKVPNIE